MITNFSLTNKEAKELIEMLKKYVDNDSIIQLPNIGRKIEFEVVGKENKNSFIININRMKIDKYKYTFQGRTALENNLLMRLDVGGDTLVHMNPNGTKIKGTHLHIYNENDEMGYAIPFDVNKTDLVETCLKFFEEFHILKDNIKILYQEEV